LESSQYAPPDRQEIHRTDQGRGAKTDDQTLGNGGIDKFKGLVPHGWLFYRREAKVKTQENLKFRVFCISTDCSILWAARGLGVLVGPIHFEKGTPWQKHPKHW
jgi:hypothetical protein